MTRAMTYVLATVMLSSTLPAQGPIVPPSPTPQARSTVRPNQYGIVVAGCVRGKRLAPAEGQPFDVSAEALRASEFVLEGPRELMRQIREHDNHLDEIAGIAIIPPELGGERSDVTTKPLGKRARVTVGNRSDSGGPGEPLRPVRLKVASLRHMSDTCLTRR